jgi:predicted metal-dependent phosphoesterase TrpH
MKEEAYLTFFEDNFRWWLQPEDKKQKLNNMPAPDIIDTIKIILKAGGVPVLAHPHNQEKYVDKLIKEGLMGLEVRHDRLLPQESERLIRIADENRLYKTGGTDHNGVLGGYLDFGEQYKVDPMMAGTEQDDFMKLYRRELG